MFNIEADLREEYDIGPDESWVVGKYMPLVLRYYALLKDLVGEEFLGDRRVDEGKLVLMENYQTRSPQAASAKQLPPRWR